MRVPKLIRSALKGGAELVSKIPFEQVLSSAQDEQILAAIDRAIRIPAKLVSRRAQRLRKIYPDLSADELVEKLSKRFVKLSAVAGGATGGAAFFPGIGTAASLALTSAQLATFVSHTAWFVLTVAELKGIEATDNEVRRTLILTSLLGPESANEVAQNLGSEGALWARATLASLSASQNSSLTRMLAKYAAKKFTRTSAKQLIGRALPLGVGAVIGFTATRKLAAQVVSGVYAGLGELEKSHYWTSKEALLEAETQAELKGDLALPAPATS